MTCADCIHFFKNIRPHCFTTLIIVDEDSEPCNAFKHKEEQNGNHKENKEHNVED